MERQILHVDVNNAFLSWTAVEMLKQGSKIDIREIPSVIGGDETKRAGIVLAKSPKAKIFGIISHMTSAFHYHMLILNFFLHYFHFAQKRGPKTVFSTVLGLFYFI